MSVVLQMKKPGTCRECFDTHRCFGTGKWYADGTIWCGLAKGYIGDERTKCPVIELPERHGRLVDAGNAFNKIVESSIDGYISNVGVYSCLHELNTIVPAERSEKDGR